MADNELNIQITANGSQANSEIDATTQHIAQTTTEVSGLQNHLNGLKTKLLGAFTFAAVVSFASDLIKVNREMESLKAQLKSVTGTAEGAARAFASIQKFAIETPFEVKNLTATFIKLRSFGIEPTNEVMLAITNQASRLGGSVESLEGITLALGQAWAKGKLQGEEIGQMIERRVPVWSLLEQVTGKNTAALQKMSEAGDLGRETIQKLILKMGEMSSGANLEAVNTLNGAFSNLSDSWTRFEDNLMGSKSEGFLRRLINTGVEYVDYFDRALNGTQRKTIELGETVDEIAKKERKIAAMEIEGEAGKLIDDLTGEDLQVEKAKLDSLKKKKQRQLDEFNSDKKHADDLAKVDADAAAKRTALALNEKDDGGKAEAKALDSGFKLKEQYLKNAHDRSIAQAGDDALKRLAIEKDYNEKVLQLKLNRIEAERGLAVKDLTGKQLDSPSVKAELADLDNQKLAAIDDAKTKGVTLDIDLQKQADNLRDKTQAAQWELEAAHIDLEQANKQAEQKTVLDDLKRDKDRGDFSGLDKKQSESGQLWNLAPQIAEYMMSKGWSKVQAAGIAANLWEESNFRTTAVGDKTMKDKTTGKTVARPESGWAYGVGQWREDRADKFQERNNGKHLKDSTLKEQLDYYDWELRNKQGEGKARNAMLSATTTKQAATAGVYFERPADESGAIASRSGLAAKIAERVNGDGEKQLLAQVVEGTKHYYETVISVESKGIDDRIAAVKAKLALAEKEYTTKKATATPEELPKIEADYTTNKAKLTQELSQLQAELLAIKKDGDAEMAKEIAKAKQDEIDIDEAHALDLIKIAETEAQQQLELGQLSNSKFLAKQQAFENQRYQIALKAAKDRAALLDEGDVSGKAKALGAEKALTNKHAADMKAINHKMALDSQQSFNSIVAPIKSAFASNIQGILQGTLTLKQGMKNIFQSIMLSYAQTLTGMAIDAAAHWAWELLGFGAKETTKTVLKITSETVQTGATIAGVAARAGAEFAGAATSKTTGLVMSGASIMDAAAKAAAGTYASVAQIPYVGWILAPPAAALAFVAVAGYKSMLSSKGGDYNVSEDGVRMIHEQETIMPAQVATPMRDFFANGYQKLMNPATVAAPMRDYFTKPTAVATAKASSSPASNNISEKTIKTLEQIRDIAQKSLDIAIDTWDTARRGTKLTHRIFNNITSGFVSSFTSGGLASSAGGEWDVPEDRLNFVHKNETIMPAQVATPMRDFFANGYQKLMNPATVAAPIREFFANQGNIGYSLPANITQPQTNQAGAMATAASAIATQQAMMQAQQKQQRQPNSGTVILNTKGGDWVNKNDVAKVLKDGNRNFKVI